MLKVEQLGLGSGWASFGGNLMIGRSCSKERRFLDQAEAAMAVFCNSAYPMVLTGPFLPKGKQFDLGGNKQT